MKLAIEHNENMYFIYIINGPALDHKIAKPNA